MAIKVFAIAAMDEGRVIGHQGKLPWRLPEDMQHFSNLTTGHTVIMGRKTFESLPPRFRPLPERKNIVISREPERVQNRAGAIFHTSIERALAACEADVTLPSEKVWIIGGAEIYRQSVDYWLELHLTLVYGQHAGDTYFPEFEQHFDLADRIERSTHAFLRYVRRRD